MKNFVSKFYEFLQNGPCTEYDGSTMECKFADICVRFNHGYRANALFIYTLTVRNDTYMQPVANIEKGSAQILMDICATLNCTHQDVYEMISPYLAVQALADL